MPRVGVGHGVGQQLDDASRLGGGHGGRAGAGLERAAGDEFQGEEGHLRPAREGGVFAHLEDFHDVGVVELGDGPGLGLESLEEFGREPLGPDHLDRHLAVEPQGARLVHLAHSALTEQARHDVAGQHGDAAGVVVKKPGVNDPGERLPALGQLGEPVEAVREAVQPLEVGNQLGTVSTQVRRANDRAAAFLLGPAVHEVENSLGAVHRGLSCRAGY